MARKPYSVPVKDEERELRSQLRKQRVRFQLDRLRKTWRTYYRSGYGKAGFYLILFFVIFTALSPVLITHRDSYTYVAPLIDTTSPVLLASGYAGSPVTGHGFPISSYGSAINYLGSNYVYTINANGQIKAMSLQAGQTSSRGTVYNVANVSIGNSVPVAMSVFTLVRSYSPYVGTADLEHYFLVATDSGIINLTMVVSANPYGHPIPPYAASWESVSLQNSTFVLPPISSVLPLDQGKIPQIMPAYSASASLFGGSDPNLGRIFAVTQSTTNSSYYLTEIMDSGLNIAWTEKLPVSSPPAGIQMYGSFFTHSQSQLIVLADQNSILAYHMNGSLAWEDNLTGETFTGNMFVPQNYQLSPASYNMILAAANGPSAGTLYAINAMNGSKASVFQVPSQDITAISSSPGSSGFPTSTVAITGKDIFLLNGPNSVIEKLPVPYAGGTYNYNPPYNAEFGTFIITSSEGALYSLSASAGSTPYTWGLQLPSSLNSVSTPNLVQDAVSGQGAVTFTAGDGYIYVYSLYGKSLNPIPPTLHTPSGGVFPLGTNVAGNDVWSQFLSGFSSAWIIGAMVGVISMLLAVVFGIYTGYYRGVASNAIEIISLAVFLMPAIALLIAVTAAVKASLVSVALILSFTSWPFITFTILGVVRTLKQRAFIEAARVSGAGSMQILRRHVIPNLLPLLAYLTAVTIGGAVGAVSALQFLQLVPSATIQTWGSMLWLLYYNYFLAANAPWWILPPTLALTFFIMAFIFVSRGIDEVANPRLRA